MAKQKYNPSRTFADDLSGFVDLYRRKKWSFSNVDLAVLEQDVLDQRAEKENRNVLAGSLVHARDALNASQAGRYRRYSTAFKAASEAFRDNPGIAAELRRFRRSFRRRKANGEKDGEE